MEVYLTDIDLVGTVLWVPAELGHDARVLLPHITSLKKNTTDICLIDSQQNKSTTDNMFGTRAAGQNLPPTSLPLTPWNHVQGFVR